MKYAQFVTFMLQIGDAHWKYIGRTFKTKGKTIRALEWNAFIESIPELQEVVGWVVVNQFTMKR